MMGTKLPIFVLISVFFTVGFAYNATLYTTKDALEDQYIVVIKPNYDVETIKRAIFSDTSGIFSDTIIKWTYTKALRGFSAKLSPAALEKVRAMEAVKYICEDGVVKLDSVASWGLDRIDQRYLPLDGSANYTGNGSNVNVYIIDTGIYPDSLYFGGRAEVAFDAVKDGREGIDCNGHGTHCAGTIGSDVYGIARGAKLFGVRVLNCYGFGSNTDVIAGCDYVAANAIHPAVASMSLGGGANKGTDDAVKGMINVGVTVVVAAGNSYDDACNYSPARVEQAITVGATDINDARASFSCIGKCVDGFAPGVEITSAWIGGTEETNTISGTSMACPHVAGAAAIALGNDPNLTPKELGRKLRGDATAKVVEDPGEGSPNRLLYIP